MRSNQRTFSAAEIVPESFLAPLDLPGLFARPAPLEVDLGCGDGSFLVARAEQEPARNFIGVERLAGRARSACRKIGDRGLPNVRIVPHEILPTVQQLFAPASVDGFYLLFPDPWPKRRHHNRRIFSGRFLHAVERALKPGGWLQVATDAPDYFTAMRDVLTEAPALLSLVQDAERIALPASTFEERFRQRAAEIYRMSLRKSGALQLADG